jgi:Ca2+-binding EF-hand superfamily protein
MIGLPRTEAELSDRRKRAIIDAFRRIDISHMNRVGAKELAAGLQRFSNLSTQEQSSLVGAILSHSGAGAIGEVSLGHFVSYYSVLGKDIRRDRDFEDIMHQHWGFAKVEDILDDMKNKFSIFGLAYAFQKSPSGGDPTTYTPRSFQTAISSVGINYQSAEVDRVFKAFSPTGDKKLSSLDLMQHLTSAPRPTQPEGPQAWSTAAVSPFGASPAKRLGGMTTSTSDDFPPVEAAPSESAPKISPHLACPTSAPRSLAIEEPTPAPLGGQTVKGLLERAFKTRDLAFPSGETAPPESMQTLDTSNADAGGSTFSSAFGVNSEPDSMPPEGGRQMMSSSGMMMSASYIQRPRTNFGLPAGAGAEFYHPPAETAPPEYSPHNLDMGSFSQSNTLGEDPSSAPQEGMSSGMQPMDQQGPPLPFATASTYGTPMQFSQRPGYAVGGEAAFPPGETAPPEHQPASVDTSILDE